MNTARSILDIIIVTLFVHLELVHTQLASLLEPFEFMHRDDIIEHHKAWQNSGKFQGDIDGVDERFFRQSANVLHNAMRNKQMLWPDGLIPYVLDDAFTIDELNVLKGAFEEYRKHTCVHFEERQQQRDYLHILKGLGCYSQVGRTGGRQEVSLGRGCLFHEIVVHELMHAVGFWHEHSRADRDDYIQIQWDNIKPGMEAQFDKISSAIQDLQGEQYDYRSIMHYDSTAFSVNGFNTMEAVDRRYTSILGTAFELSETDIRKINKLYKCHPRKKTTTPKATTNASVTNTNALELCDDRFPDCPYFENYCSRHTFRRIMRKYCPVTCKYCS